MSKSAQISANPRGKIRRGVMGLRRESNDPEGGVLLSVVKKIILAKYGDQKNPKN